MVTPSDVYSQFLFITAPDAEDGTDKILSLCASALEHVVSALRKESTDEDSRIAYAAAGIAYYDYALSTLADVSDPKSFKAGDITVNRDAAENISVAEKIRDSRLKAISDLIEDREFGAWNV